jgi:hypothetical protein
MVNMLNRLLLATLANSMLSLNYEISFFSPLFTTEIFRVLFSIFRFPDWRFGDLHKNKNPARFATASQAALESRPERGK